MALKLRAKMRLKRYVKMPKKKKLPHHDLYIRFRKCFLSVYDFK